MGRHLPDWIRTLAPHRAGLWYGLVAPLLCLTIGLKTARIATRGLEGGLLSIPDLYTSALTGVAAFGLAGHTLLGLIDSGRLRHLALGVFQLLALLVGALELVGHGFYLRTGSMLDFPLLWRVLDTLSNNWAIILSELSTTYVVLIAVALAILLVVPWMARSLQAEARDEETTTADDRLRWTLPAALVLTALSLTPPLIEPDTWFARSTTANLAVSFGWTVSASFDAPPDVDNPAADVAVADRETAGDPPDNVAIVVLESVRADATSLDNPDRETTPFLRGLAEDSTVARRAYATVPHTSKALVSILCGIEPRFSLEVTESRPGGIPARCLPEVLGDHGYTSAFFQSAHPYYERRPRLVKNLGFDGFFSMHDLDQQAYHKINYFGWEEDAMLPVSRRWLETHGDDPFVATYLTLSGHHPYATPPDFEGVDPPEDPPPAADDFGRYLDTVRYVDRFARKLVDQYKRLGLYEETLFVFVSDHGEAFGEHGQQYHDDVPYEEGIRIVTMLHDPTRPMAEDLDHNVSQIDLPPTILDRLGFRLTEGAYRGTAYADLPDDRPVRSFCYYEWRCLMRIDGDTKFIYRFGLGPPEVYDLSADPEERDNLADGFDRLDDWRRDLLDWRRHVTGLYAGTPDR